jgi:hypothetical protein
MLFPNEGRLGAVELLAMTLVIMSVIRVRKAPSAVALLRVTQHSPSS